MKRFTIAALLLCAATAFAQGRPMTFDDMMAVRRVGAPRVSPDGKWLTYDVSTIDMAANKRKSAVYLVATTGGTPTQISDGSKQDENPVWSPDGKTIAFVSNKDGGAKQIYLYDVATKATRKVSDLPNGAGSLLWSPTGDGLALVSDIYPDCGVDVNCTKQRSDAEENAPTKARIIEGLLYRHWTAWQPATRSHILFQPLNGGAVRDLTPGKFDAPPFSLGGGDSFDISPDGREFVYASNTDPHPETSTNSELFIVPLSGGTPKKISTSPGADDTPIYSPDGKWIAFKSQARAGYESDLWQLMLYNRSTGAITAVAPAFNQWVDEFRWAPDSKSIFFAANEQSHVGIYQVSVPTGLAKRLYSAGSSSSLNVSRDGKTIYFDRNSLQRPNEIFALDRKSGKATQVTHENDALFANIAMGEVSDI